MKREIKLTKDGSHSIYLPEMDEQYHSIHGSIAEAKKVYIEYGLEKTNQRSEIGDHKGEVNLLEMGFGTGLNALLSLKFAKEHKLQLNYTTIEKYPISPHEIKELNFAVELGMDSSMFEALHSVSWGEAVDLDEQFTLTKFGVDLREMEFNSKFDIVYFDAFAPEKQPYLWTEGIFQKLFDCLNDGGILTTYCVKGEVRRRLKKVGFEIEKLSGPEGGKREVLRARKKI